MLMRESVIIFQVRVSLSPIFELKVFFLNSNWNATSYQHSIFATWPDKKSKFFNKKKSANIPHGWQEASLVQYNTKSPSHTWVDKINWRKRIIFFYQYISYFIFQEHKWNSTLLLYKKQCCSVLGDYNNKKCKTEKRGSGF